MEDRGMPGSKHFTPKDVSNGILAVLLTIAMATQSIPASAFAEATQASVAYQSQEVAPSSDQAADKTTNTQEGANTPADEAKEVSEAGETDPPNASAATSDVAEEAGDADGPASDVVEKPDEADESSGKATNATGDVGKTTENAKQADDAATEVNKTSEDSEKADNAGTAADEATAGVNSDASAGAGNDDEPAESSDEPATEGGRNTPADGTAAPAKAEHRSGEGTPGDAGQAPAAPAAPDDASATPDATPQAAPKGQKTQEATEEGTPSGKADTTANTPAEQDLSLETQSSTGTASQSGSLVTSANQREYVKAKVTKVWDDAEDQDGKRPSCLSVNLMVSTNGATPVKYSDVLLTSENDWTAEVANLPTTDDEGNNLEYSWHELPQTALYDLSELGYTFDEEEDVAVEGELTTLTNHHTPQTTSATVRKVWDDNNNSLMMRPSTLYVQLLANGKDTGKGVMLTAENNWAPKSIGNLPKYEGGKPIAYSWSDNELGDIGYVLTNVETKTDANGFVTTTLTNSLNPTETVASVHVIWDDENDQDRLRPSYIEVSLLADGAAATDDQGTPLVVTLAADEDYFAMVWGLPLLNPSTGNKIVYTWQQQSPEGYTEATPRIVSGTLTTIVNEHTPQKVRATVQKTWDDDDNRDGVRPASLDVTLYGRYADDAGGQVEHKVLEHTLTASENWKFSTGRTLNKRIDGHLVAYEWRESPEDLPAGYSLTENAVTYTYEDDTTGTELNADIKSVHTQLTNTKEIETTEASVMKVWDDDGNRAGKRPDTLAVDLVANDRAIMSVTLNEDNAWSATINGLPKNENGKVIPYTWKETAPEGYTLSSATTNGTHTILTNTFATGEIVLAKRLVSEAAADANREFEFTVTLDDATINGTYGNMEFTDGTAIVTLKGGQSARATMLPAGTGYAITEEPTKNFSLERVTVDGAPVEGTEARGVVALEPTAVVFVNEHDKGSIELTKKVTSTRVADTNAEFAFTVRLNDDTISGTYGDVDFRGGVGRVSVRDGETKRMEGLPVGVAYEIIEDADENFVVSGIAVDGEEQEEAAKGVVSDEPSKVEFTNSEATGELVVEKTVKSTNAADKTKEFTFRVSLEGLEPRDEPLTLGDMTFGADGVAEFTLKGGESATTGQTVPTGIAYTVTEEAEDGWTTAATGETGIISASTSTAHFTNTKTEGNLVVRKLVDSVFDEDATRDYAFEVTLGDAGIGGQFGDMAFQDGVATFSLRAGEELEARGLPEGVAYHVDEVLSDQQSQTFDNPTWENQTGTIAKDATTTAVATNRRKTGSIVVTKRVVSNQEDDATRAFAFTVTLNNSAINGVFGDASAGKTMTFHDGVATFELAKDEVANANNLPYGVSYEVAEDTPDGFEVSWSGSTSGTIDKDNANVVLEATNTRVESPTIPTSPTTPTTPTSPTTPASPTTPVSPTTPTSPKTPATKTTTATATTATAKTTTKAATAATGDATGALAAQALATAGVAAVAVGIRRRRRA